MKTATMTTNRRRRRMLPVGEPPASAVERWVSEPFASERLAEMLSRAEFAERARRMAEELAHLQALAKSD